MISVSKGKGRMGRGRAPCCEKVGLKRGTWTAEEDARLVSHIQKHGHTNWRALPKQAGLLRCGKSCRLRWFNYLRPDIKRGDFSPEEEETLISLHRLLGNSWSKIAAHLPGRTDNGIKNVWNTHIKKRLQAKENPSPCSSSISVESKCDQDDHADIDVWDVLNAESQPQIVALSDTDAKHDADGILSEEVGEKGRWLLYLEEELGILEEELGLFNAAGIEEDCGNGCGG